MLEILQFYVSSFWIWLGITIGVSIFIQSLFIGIKEISNIPVKRRKRKSSEPNLAIRRII